MNTDQLEQAWDSLTPPPRAAALNGIRARGLPLQAAVWLALDHNSGRHVLVEVSATTELVTERGTRGLHVRTGEFRIADSPPANYIDLACLDARLHQTFSAVAQDVLTSVRATPADPRMAVIRSLQRWKWFWSVDPTGLDQQAALGLFGELWFLDRWMGPLSVAVLDRWVGPTGARHDFAWEAASIEVKATSAKAEGGPIHRIADLDQLEDPQTGGLYLFSLQVREDTLAANTLVDLIERLRTRLAEEPEAASAFDQRLAEVGYSPAHSHRYTRRMRIVAEELYRVEGKFPRLTRSSFPSGLPPGISRISYSLSLAACAPWRIATSPFDETARDLLHTGGPSQSLP